MTRPMRGMGRFDPETMDLARPRDVHVVRLMLPFLWPQHDLGLRVRLMVSIFLLGITSALSALSPVLLARGIDQLSQGPAAPLTLVLALLFGYGAAYTIGRVLGEWRWSLFGPVEQRLQRNVRLTVFRHVHELSFRFHVTRKTGQLARVIDNGVRGIEQILSSIVFMILPLVMEVGFMVAVLLNGFSATYTGIIFVAAVLYSTAVFFGSGILRKHQRAAVTESAAAHGKAIDSLLNYETVKFFGNEDYVAGRYDDALRNVERLSLKARFWLSLTGIVQALIMGSCLTVVVLYAGRQALAGTITVGAFVLVSTYVLLILRPLDTFGRLYRGLKQSFTDVEQMTSLLLEVPEVANAPDAVALPLGRGAIAFREVSFAYDPRRAILRSVSFEVPAGTSVGLVGTSGAGKTTIGRLLFRFYDSTTGSIQIDGVDSRQVTIASLRAAIGVVPQDAVLFNDTLAYNIAFGSPGASRDEIERAARSAQIHDFIVSLPDGYETAVGERGLKLSGGEKQRVAIARAILKRPRIYLFDEATSALDTRTERAIQDNLREVSRGTTTVIIAHRLSTVVHADQILVLEDGRVVEHGNHDSLLRDGGHYAALWMRQQ